MTDASIEPDQMCTHANELAASKQMPLARELDMLRLECERLRARAEAAEAAQADNELMAAELNVLRREREAKKQHLDPIEWLPPKVIAFELGITRQGMIDRVRNGRVPFQKIGGRVLIHAPSARHHHKLLTGHASDCFR